jgi:hypothetical protein
MSQTSELRARIAELDAAGLKPPEIARRVGCALSTVYKIRQRPGPDRRALWDWPANRVDEATAVEVLALAAEDPTRSARAIQAIMAEARAAELAEAADAGAAGAPGAAPVPSLSTIERLRRRLDEVEAGGGRRAEAGAPTAAGVYASPEWEDYAAVSAVETDSLEDEILVLRAAVRRNSRRLAEESLEEGERLRVESHVRGLVESLALLVRSRSRSGPSLAALRAAVAGIGRRKTGWDEALEGPAGALEAPAEGA